MRGFWNLWLGKHELQGVLDDASTAEKLESFRRLLTLDRVDLSLFTLQAVILEEEPGSSQPPVSIEQIKAEIISTARNWVPETKRQPFITEKRYIGAGPTSLQEGDIIVVPLGSKVPVILRPKEDVFHLVEECCKSSLQVKSVLYGVPRITCLRYSRHHERRNIRATK
jgi:hypothetical protein